MASSLPPELMQFLLEQQQAEGRGAKGKPHQFPTQPSMSNVPSSAVQKGGVFSNPNGGGRALQMLRQGVNFGPPGAMRKMTKAGGALGTGLALLPIAQTLGNIAGDAYYKTAMEDAYNSENRAVPTEKPIVETRPNENTVDFEGIPIEQMLGEEAAHGADMGAPVAVEEIPPEMLVEAQVDYPALLQQRERPIAQELPQSRATLSALGQNVSERPAPFVRKDKSFLQKTGDFFRYGGRDGDADRHMRELELFDAQNRLSEREKFGGGVAKDDVFDTRRMNHASAMAEYAGAGVTPADRFMADYYRELEAEGRQSREAEVRDTRRHEQEMEQIGAQMVGRGKTPEQQREEFIQDFALRYPDAVEGMLAERGIQADPAALMSIRAGRAPAEDRALMTIKALQSAGLLRGAAQGSQSVSDAKKRTVSDTSMLENKKENK